jgi:Protein of unknown function (DUF2752)
VNLPLCPLHATTGLWCPLCGSLRGISLLAHGQVLAALGSNLLLLVTLPALAWGAFALAGGAEVRGPSVPSRAWIGVGLFALAYTVLRNLPIGSALAP